ncbi:MAG: hypothetical protein M3Y48_19845 [Actinomycetota bacterium]|nr:hypothetical protein [Actinomycetota bacterium]
MTAFHNQRPAPTTTGKDTPTLTHRQQHDHNTLDAPNTATAQPHPPRHSRDTAPTDISAAPKPLTPQLAAYVRHVVDTAPAPTPAQLERLAGLLRDPDNPSTSN